MAANPERGELEVEALGNENRILRYQTAELLLLEEQLGKDVLSYVAERGGQTKFLVAAVYSGLSRGKDKKLTPIRVAGWFDTYKGDRTELQKRILLAIARGKPGEEGAEMVRILQESFGGDESKEDSPAASSASSAG